jgi:hypothetical protein
LVEEGAGVLFPRFFRGQLGHAARCQDRQDEQGDQYEENPSHKDRLLFRRFFGHGFGLCRFAALSPGLFLSFAPAADFALTFTHGMALLSRGNDAF